MRGFPNVYLSVLQLSFLGFGISQKYDGDSCITSDEREGICRPFSQCRVVQEELQRGKSPVNCSFQGSHPIVCCLKESDSAIDGTSSRTTDPSKNPGEKSEDLCRGHVKLCSRRRLIAGGVPATPSEFPHMAAVGYGEENNKQWSCGGTLISEKFVMTAGHCLNAGSSGPARWVLLGTESLTSGLGRVHPIIRRIPHPDYKPPAKYNDLALLEIGDPITTGNDSIPIIVRPACLPKGNENYNSSKAVATGWGRTGAFDDGSPELLKVELDILDTSKCNETFALEIRSTETLRRGIDNTMICAGVLEGGKDTCPGDSGGQLLSIRRESCVLWFWESRPLAKCVRLETRQQFILVFLNMYHGLKESFHLSKIDICFHNNFQFD